MSNPVSKFTIQVEQKRGFEFLTTFDKAQLGVLKTDEPPPLGKDSGPNPARLLAAAVGNCLAASLVFCAKKAGLELESVKAEVDVEIVRNENKRLRIGKIAVRLFPNVPAPHAALSGCLDAFQDYCMVTESVRHGIDVEVAVETGATTRP